MVLLRMIEIDAGLLLSILTLLIFGPIAWVIKQLVNDVRGIEREMADMKTHIAESYVEKRDLHRELGEIKDMLRRVFEKLDGK